MKNKRLRVFIFSALLLPTCLYSMNQETNEVEAKTSNQHVKRKSNKKVVRSTLKSKTQKLLVSDSSNKEDANQVNTENEPIESGNRNDALATKQKAGITKKEDNEEAQDNDLATFATIKAESQTTSSVENPLSYNDKVYSLAFNIENTSNVNKVIPKGTKLTITVKPDPKVPYNLFLIFDSINQETNNFSVTDNSNGTFDVTTTKDLTPGSYNFIVNFITQNPGYDWDKPSGTNSTNPDVVPGTVTVDYFTGKDSVNLLTDNVYVKPKVYGSDGGGVYAPGFAVSGYNRQHQYNVEPEYPDETNTLYPSDGGPSLRNPNNKSRSGHMYFSYLATYNSSLNPQIDPNSKAHLAIISTLPFDLEHCHLLMETGENKVVDISKEDGVNWSQTAVTGDPDYQYRLDVYAGDYMVAHNYTNTLALRAYVPTDDITAVNKVKFIVGSYSGNVNNNITTFQSAGTDINVPYFRGGQDVTIYDTGIFDATKGIFAYEGNNSLTDKIKVTDYNGYPENGKNPKVGTYAITYSVTGSDTNKSTTFSRKITVLHNGAAINAKDSTIVAGTKSTWEPKDNFISATDKDGNSINLNQLNVKGTVNPQKVDDYQITYSYQDDTGLANIDKIVIVHVVQSKASIKAHDTTIYQGDNWNPVSSFGGATDANGNSINFDKVSVSGNVDTQKLGTYPVKYSYTDTAGNTVEADVNVTVKQRVEKLPVKAGDVTVHFVDASGNKIAPDKILSGNVGDGYISSPLDIEGYIYDSVNGNRIGYFTNLPQTVTYVYHKKASTTKPEQSTDNNSTNKLLPNDKAKKPDNNKKPKQTSDAQTSGKNKSALTQEDKQSAKTVNKLTSVSDSKAKLPQTGTEKKSQLALLISGIIALFGSLLGVLGLRKKKGE